MSEIALFHSFPRMARTHSEDEVELGVHILNSIVESGFLLVPEHTSYPFVRPNGLDYTDGTDIDQLRCCFTLLDREEVVHHAAKFGAFSIEFDVKFLRSIGAFPVIYIPQPVKGETGYLETSIIGNNIVHQMRDIIVLLTEIVSLSKLVERERANDSVELKFDTSRKSGSITLGQIDLVLDFLLGEKVSFSNLLEAAEFVCSMFYHADTSKTEKYFFDNDLRYYHQREWRLAAGFVVAGIPLDRELTKAEVDRLMTINDFFKRNITLKSGSIKSRALASRMISRVFGRDLIRHARAIFAPDVIVDKIRQSTKDVEIIGVDYGKILRIRESPNVDTGD